MGTCMTAHEYTHLCPTHKEEYYYQGLDLVIEGDEDSYDPIHGTFIHCETALP